MNLVEQVSLKTAECRERHARIMAENQNLESVRNAKVAVEYGFHIWVIMVFLHAKRKQ